jgi:cystathionine beta-lyase/cystathionine gamma-synthase
LAASEQMGIGTVCVRAGEDPHTRASATPLTVPIAQTSVFAATLDELKRNAQGDTSAYMYTRYANPTTRAAEEKIAALEGAEDCVVTASGQSAMLCALLATCRPGDEIVAMQDLYGGTLKLLSAVLAEFGISIKLVPYSELPSLDRHISEKTRLVILESPTNPTLRIADIAGCTLQAHARGALVLVDNTFATPILQRPLEMGADLVMHSATKYLGGHSDISAGAIVGSKELVAHCRKFAVLSGGTLDPHASFLLIRGMKTLEIRMERACANARRIAEALSRNAQIERVFFPGLPDHAEHELATRQMSDFGAMVSIEIAGGGAAAERFLNRLKLWQLAASLGGVESTVSYPVWASHVGLEDQWDALGITPALVRLSVGIESHVDLIADLEHALERSL